MPGTAAALRVDEVYAATFADFRAYVHVRKAEARPGVGVASPMARSGLRALEVIGVRNGAVRG